MMNQIINTRWVDPLPMFIVGVVIIVIAAYFAWRKDVTN